MKVATRLSSPKSRQFTAWNLSKNGSKPHQFRPAPSSILRFPLGLQQAVNSYVDVIHQLAEPPRANLLSAVHGASGIISQNSFVGRNH
jgi:hypothetical protein